MTPSNYGPVGDDIGTLARFGALTARTVLGPELTSTNFAVVEHQIAPRGLAAPLHMHSREDEFTVITEGRIGFLLGDEVFHAGPGDLVLKPRDQWHTFWNASDEPARVMEIISPAGFENYFEEISRMFSEDGTPDLAAIAGAVEKYGLQMDFGSMPELIKRFNLSAGPEPSRPRL